MQNTVKLKQMLHDGERGFLGRVAATRPSFSPAMARLATFICDHYVQVAFMNTRQLAAAAGVSPATVVRFPIALGYQNFGALRAAIQQQVSINLTGVERLQALPNSNRSSAVLLRRIIDADIESLRALTHTFSELQVERFVEALLGAERVGVLGVRYVAPLATYFAYSLAKIRPSVQAYTQSDSVLYDRLRLMDSGDLLVVVTFARYPRDLVALVRYAAGRGLRVVAITDSVVSPVMPFCEVALFAKASPLDFVGSLAAPAALINCVVSEAAVRLGDTAVARLQALEEAASDAQTYLDAGAREGSRDGSSRSPAGQRNEQPGRVTPARSTAQEAHG